MNKKFETEADIKVMKTMLKMDGLLETERDICMETMELKPIEESQLNYETLSEKEKERVDGLVQSLNLVDTNSVIEYGAEVQGKLAQFSSGIIDHAKTKKAGEVGDILASLVAQINDFNVNATQEKKGIFKFFNQMKNSGEKLLAKYSTVETNVDKIVGTLEKNRMQLLKDVTIFEMMYDENTAFFNEISLYIVAGEKKLEMLRTTELGKLKEKAKNGDDGMAYQAVADMEALVNRFDKKIHDLKLSRVVSLQMAPQIRMLQAIDSELVDKIQSSIINTIPLWKTQIVMALGITNAKLAYQSEKLVNDTTNELLRKNSELLKQGAIEVAKESERAIVDIETIKSINASILSTVSEVIQIQETGKLKRLETEKALETVEESLKNERKKYES